MVSDTRRRILVTAAKLFAENGYEGVRTKEIAKASKISEVTLFKYFPKKEVLYHTLLDEFFHTLDLAPLVENLSFTDLHGDLSQIANAISENLIDNIHIVLMRQKEKTDFFSDKKFNAFVDPSYVTVLPVFQHYYQAKKISISPEIACNIFITTLVGSFGLLAANNFNEAYLKKW
ncbi:MAG: hypothetical protein ACFWTN_09725 [Clostridium sp.]|jgi:AcrR family transcriptional regulator